MVIISWCVYVYKNRDSQGSSTKSTASIIMVFWTVLIGLPNIPVLLMPFSPPIHGHVTNQPSSGCNIKAYWVIEEIGLAGGHTETYKQFSTKTDAQGNFVIPRRIKALTVLGFLPALQLASYYGGINILAYAYGHPYTFERLEGSKQLLSLTPLKLSMNLMPPASEYLRSKMFDLGLKFDTWNSPRGVLTDEDKEYLLKDKVFIFSNFKEIFTGADPKEIYSALIRLGSGLGDYGDYKTAIDVFQKLKNEFPEATKFADREIEQLKSNTKGQRNIE